MEDFARWISPTITEQIPVKPSENRIKGLQEEIVKIHKELAENLEIETAKLTLNEAEKKESLEREKAFAELMNSEQKRLAKISKESKDRIKKLSQHTAEFAKLKKTLSGIKCSSEDAENHIDKIDFNVEEIDKLQKFVQQKKQEFSNSKAELTKELKRRAEEFAVYKETIKTAKIDRDNIAVLRAEISKVIAKIKELTAEKESIEKSLKEDDSVAEEETRKLEEDREKAVHLRSVLVQLETAESNAKNSDYFQDEIRKIKIDIESNDVEIQKMVKSIEESKDKIELAEEEKKMIEKLGDELEKTKVEKEKEFKRLMKIKLEEWKRVVEEKIKFSKMAKVKILVEEKRKNINCLKTKNSIHGAFTTIDGYEEAIRRQEASLLVRELEVEKTEMKIRNLEEQKVQLTQQSVIKRKSEKDDDLDMTAIIEDPRSFENSTFRTDTTVPPVVTEKKRVVRKTSKKQKKDTRTPSNPVETARFVSAASSVDPFEDARIKPLLTSTPIVPNARNSFMEEPVTKEKEQKGVKTRSRARRGRK